MGHPGVGVGTTTGILRLRLRMTGRKGKRPGLDEVAACDLQDVGEEAGSLEVHAVVGE
jgi:hypothetical protein